MESYIHVKRLDIQGKLYWQLADLPHVLLQASDEKDFSTKILQILPAYFKKFPSERIRILNAPEMLRIPLKM